MFLAAPTSTGVRVRTLPIATLILALALVACAAWTLPGRRALCAARYGAQSALADSGACAARVAQPSPVARLETMRRDALRARVQELEAADAVEGSAYFRGAPPSLAVTALCLHGDVVHLLTNLIGLLLAGVFVEIVIGPVWTLLLAIAGGAIALYADAALGPPGLLVGFSSAVAVLFGAYTVIYRSRRIRFAWVYLEHLRLVRGSFHVPAPVIAVIWLAQQWVGMALAARGESQGIAYASHLVGFGLGVVSALLLWHRQLPAPETAPGA